VLDRSLSPSGSARRSRERRARRRAGILRDFKVRVPTKRLIAALRLAEPKLPAELPPEVIERELAQVVLAFIETWLGPPRRK
jgi:hypothetical protein